MKRFSLLFSAFLFLCSASVSAQSFTPPSNKNAALRYWMAFAEMTDRSADDATTKLLEGVLSGTANWDEQRLGPIVDENSAAVHTLQRATELPECNWGLEYGRGAAMSIGHLPKARVLARLNALYGARQMARGDVAGAVNTWLTGLHFAQDVGKDVGLIGLLSAKPAFLANLHLLARAVQNGAVNTDIQKKIKLQLQKLPNGGLNWTDSIKSEVWADEESLGYLANAANFQETYKEFFGQPPPQTAQPPSAEDIAGFRTYMNEVLAAFQQPDMQTQERLSAITVRTKSMNPAVQSIIPNYQKLADTRKQVSGDVQALNKALTGQK
ncbi:MAG: hypothetical protein JWM83_3140 [Candidatus Angelobacter sp.]|nr:hypothetical protein [Candidatus Angelobacter sp.]